jgi:rhamnosyltransferase
MHHPFRYYYIIRNSLLLARRPWATWRWRAADLRQSIYIAVFFGLLSKRRGESLKYMGLGLLHGLAGRAGKLNRPN